MSNELGCWFGFAILVIMVIGGLWQRNNEKKSWNNGVCKKTGERWRCFDIDSQGGRGYKSGGHCIWISYGVDK